MPRQAGLLFDRKNAFRFGIDLHTRLKNAAEKAGHSLSDEVRQRLWWSIEQDFDSAKSNPNQVMMSIAYKDGWRP